MDYHSTDVRGNRILTIYKYTLQEPYLPLDTHRRNDDKLRINVYLTSI